jgi:hypothetical protein
MEVSGSDIDEDVFAHSEIVRRQGSQRELKTGPEGLNCRFCPMCQ